MSRSTTISTTEAAQPPLQTRLVPLHLDILEYLLSAVGTYSVLENLNQGRGFSGAYPSQEECHRMANATVKEVPLTAYTVNTCHHELQYIVNRAKYDASSPAKVKVTSTPNRPMPMIKFKWTILVRDGDNNIKNITTDIGEGPWDEFDEVRHYALNEVNNWVALCACRDDGTTDIGEEPSTDAGARRAAGHGRAGSRQVLHDG